MTALLIAGVCLTGVMLGLTIWADRTADRELGGRLDSFSVWAALALAILTVTLLVVRFA